MAGSRGGGELESYLSGCNPCTLAVLECTVGRKPPPLPPQGKIPPDFRQGMWGGNASVAKFYTETYNCVRYAWIVHARDTYRRKIGILCACTARADFEHVDIVRG